MARCLRSFVLPALLIASAALVWSQNNLTGNSVSAALNGLPLAFEENHGQIDARVFYRAHAPSSTVFLTRKGVTLAWNSGALGIGFAGANPAANVSAEQQLPGKVNYLIGDATQWHRNISTYERVKYAAVYPGVDLFFYGKQGVLEYDFAVAPGAEAKNIRLRIEGAESTRIAKNGDLVLLVGGHAIRWKKPVAYQESNGKRKLVSSNYALAGDQISFEIGAYDKSRALIIDPALVYSTYLGGSVDANPFTTPNPPGSAYNSAAGVATDGSGNAYVAGITSATDFPVTGGAYDTETNGTACSPHGGNCSSGFVVKINATGTALLYSTYFGKPSSLNGVAVDASGRVYVVGAAGSNGMVPTTTNAFSQSGPSCDFDCALYGYLTVFNSAGSDLVYSTYFGPQDTNSLTITYPERVAVGSTGAAYITGYTDAPDFPTTSNAYQRTLGGENDVFLSKFDPSGSGVSSLLYSTYFGGTGGEDGDGIATEGGRAYVVGASGSADFRTTAAAYSRTNKGNTDGFVAKFDTNSSGASSLMWSTFIGGTDFDAVRGVSLLNAVPYLVGATSSSNFPTTAGAFDRTYAGNARTDAWMAKLSADGSALQYSTFVGGSYEDEATGIAVDGSGRAWATGFTRSGNFPVTADAFQKTLKLADCSGIRCTDVFFTGLNATGSGLAYSTYFGGTSDDVANGIAVRSGYAYLAGYTNSSAFPTTSSAFQKARKGYNDAFVAKFNLGSAATQCAAPSTSRTIHVCSPVTGSSVKSPVHVQATAKPGASAIKSMQVYVDGVKKYDLASSSKIDTNISMAAGARRVTVQAIDSSGAFKTTVNITVQ